MDIAVIGAGVSGLSVAGMLQDKGHKVTVYERDGRIGGLVKCSSIQGNLYHTTGGHVFNSKRKDVLEWFWRHFDKEMDFTPSKRNVAISLEGRFIGAPVENHVYEMGKETQAAVVKDLLALAACPPPAADNFEDFLKNRFGETLYNLYFGPYNRKIWRKSLRNVPLAWLEGKLPTPEIHEIILSNMSQEGEGASFVHSSFYYPRSGGSQFIADTLAKGLDIVTGSRVDRLEYDGKRWNVCGRLYDRVVYTGNVKELPHMLAGCGAELDIAGIDALEYHGTTSVLCYVDANPYSWIYMPSPAHESHRIICTGNFSPANNAPGKLSVTVEFSEPMEKAEILEQLSRIPLHPQYIAHHFEPYTYPMQNQGTSAVIHSVRTALEPMGLHLLGRFAEWQYYNMDAAMGAALDLVSSKF